jgi:hypothetical protein
VKRTAKSTTPTVAKSAAKTTAKRTNATRPEADEAKIAKLAPQLGDVEKQLARKLSDDEHTKLVAQRGKLILAMIAAGTGYTFIATTRAVSTPTNHGLCRVLQGGKGL